MFDHSLIQAMTDNFAIEKLDFFLKENKDIQIIRLQWIDFSGVLRARFIPIARCLEIARGHDTCLLAQNSMLIPISTAPKLNPLSDHHERWFLEPDWTSLRVCGYQAGHATVMSFVHQQETYRDGRNYNCPRALLHNSLEELEQNWQAKATIGFEIEFVLLDESDKVLKPMDRLNGYSRTAGLRGETLDLVEEIISALQKSSIKIHHFHAELGDQLEIALAPEPAMVAIDSLVNAQETIRTICIRRNVKAAMTPKPLLSGVTNGLHLHLSLDNIRLNEGNFLHGILSHMSSLCAFGMANYDGYVRSANDAAGAWIGYGTDNRDLPVRLIGFHRWELRMLDATANPYLFAGAVLFAGIDGLRKQMKLNWKNCNLFPHAMDKEMRLQHGITQRMPVSLKQALKSLRNDKELARNISEHLLDWYLSVKDTEVEEFAKMTEEQRRRRFLEYF